MRRGNISNKLSPIIFISSNLLFVKEEDKEAQNIAVSFVSMVLGVRRAKPIIEASTTQKFDPEVVSLLSRIYLRTDFSIAIVTIGLTDEEADTLRKELRARFIVGRVTNFESYLKLRDYINNIKTRICVYVDSDEEALRIVGEKAVSFESFKTEI